MDPRGVGGDAYAIDLDELDDTICDLEACERELERLADDLAKQMLELHDQWEGLAATAQREAHRDWAQGMHDLRAALAAMRSAARVAHDNYSLAIATNLDLWAAVA